ncbi:tyrosine-type recombinase/integrase [Bacteroides nordii]|uniref:tyrosine-type recombinase/integrase n=1 Tax=Bacteroides nordii TaxID=291645 RepID=UPI00351FA9B5
MAVTLNFELNNRPSKNNTYTVMLRITQNKKHKRIKTSIAVERKSDFNKDAKQNNWIRQREPNHEAWNQTLADEKERARKTYEDLKEDGLATTDKIASEMTASERTSSFLQYAKQRTKEIYDAGNYRNWKKHNGFCNKLEAFLKERKAKDLTFAELTTAFLSKFEVFMYSLRNERDETRKLHPNTIQVNFSIFKTLIKRAIEVEGLMKPEKNPFLSYAYKGVNTTKEKLDEGEIQKIIDLELEVDSLLWHCRNYFLFSFYCAGIRAGDLIQLRWANITSDGRLHYQMGKNHKDRDLILVEQAKNILTLYYKEEKKANDYIFPLLDVSELYAKAISQEEKDTLPTELKIKLFNQISSKNALINKYLKKLAEKAEIEKKLSFHISRHSFAKVAKQKGTDNTKLKDLLAHSSVKITENYMGSFDTSENDKALQSIFAKKEESPKDELLKLLNNMKPEEISSLIQQIKR